MWSLGEVIGPDNKHNNDFFGADYTYFPYNLHQKSHYCVFHAQLVRSSAVISRDGLRSRVRVVVVREGGVVRPMGGGVT